MNNNTEEDFDVDCIQLQMRYDQTVKVYLLLDKYKRENTELKEQLKIFKHLMSYYKKNIMMLFII